MTDHITTCVNCHGDIPTGRDAYCSDRCKHENESARPTNNGPSGYQRMRAAEVTGVSEGEQE